MAKAVHSFRSGKNQAKLIAAELAAHNTSRHKAKQTGVVAVQGLGSERSYKQVFSAFAKELQQYRAGDLWTHTRQAAVEYLERRAEVVGQSALNLDRQALDRLERHINGEGTAPLPRFKSELDTVKAGRAYSAPQLAAIRGAQTAKNAISTEIAERCGLRAHELFTLRPAAEQPQSSHRQWNDDRFKGANGTRPDGECFTVKGKGGLVRQVWISRESGLLERLEAYRLPSPERICDRGIFYDRVYSIGGGQAWSQSVSAASIRTLGWSHGAHGTRHHFAQRRNQELNAAGFSYNYSRLCLSQELGHFRVSIVDAYLR